MTRTATTTVSIFPRDFDPLGLFNREAMGESNPYAASVEVNLKTLQGLGRQSEDDANNAMNFLKTAARVDRNTALALLKVFEMAKDSKNLSDCARLFAKIGYDYACDWQRSPAA